MSDGQTPEKVALVACRTYGRDEVRSAVRRAVDLVGGIDAFVTPGRNAIIKANLLRPSPRERRVVTDGEVIRAVAELALDAGARPVVADSPGLASVAKVVSAAGIAEALAGVDHDLLELAESRPAGSTAFPALEIAGELVDATAVINVPKLKSHMQMELTAAVKNLYGAVVGKRKPQWHLRCGTNRDAFAQLLVECCRIVAPRLSVADGVIAMEGQGPGSGDPFELGAIIASTHPVAADLAFMELIGFDPALSPVHCAARGMGYGPATLQECVVLGDPVDDLRVSGFRRANVDFQMFPGVMGRALRRMLVSWPRVVAAGCVRCGQCASVCAAGAITAGKAPEGHAARIDYSKCIRCFCCHEICPERAIDLKTPLLARLLGWKPR